MPTKRKTKKQAPVREPVIGNGGQVFGYTLKNQADDPLLHMKQHYEAWKNLDLVPKERLPQEPSARKDLPLALFFDYFPDAIVEITRVIKQGQVQHQTEKWDRSKSTDHDSCLLRHYIDRGLIDSTDGMRHSAKMAIRALMFLQLELEAAGKLPPSRGSK